MSTLRFKLILLNCCVVLLFYALPAVNAQLEPQTPIHITGTWAVEFGTVQLHQDGSYVHGMFFDNDGRAAKIEGKVRDQDQRLHFVWNIGEEELGEVALTMSADGNHLSGPYANLETGRVGKIVLTRHMDVVGPWTAADVGLFDFAQDGNKVHGVLTLEDGRAAWIDGEIVNHRLHMVWGIGPEELGEAALMMSRDGSSLSGPYADLTSGRVETFALTRGR